MLAAKEEMSLYVCLSVRTLEFAFIELVNASLSRIQKLLEPPEIFLIYINLLALLIKPYRDDAAVSIRVCTTRKNIVRSQATRRTDANAHVHTAFYKYCVLCVYFTLYISPGY